METILVYGLANGLVVAYFETFFIVIWNILLVVFFNIIKRMFCEMYREHNITKLN